MKIRVVLLSFMMLSSILSAASADIPGNEVALDTAPLGTHGESLLSAKAAPIAPAVTLSQQMADEMTRMFKEGAAKLDPPRAKGLEEEQAVAAGTMPSGGRSLNVMAYSYCLSGRTASGRATAPGVVAVDTRVIPMGSKLYIPGYGWGVAADTGGAINGSKIDVWFPTLGQCYQWGVRPVTIKVFPKK